MYEQEIANLEEAINRYRTNATLPDISPLIAEGQLKQAQIFEDRLKVLFQKQSMSPQEPSLPIQPEINQTIQPGQVKQIPLLPIAAGVGIIILAVAISKRKRKN